MGRALSADAGARPVALPVARDRRRRLDPAPALPGAATSTSPSSAPGSPGSGPPTTCAEADPTLRIAVLEAEIAGFGASGRNGGWCSALFPAVAGTRWPRRRRPRRRPRACTAAMHATVDEVGRVAAAEGIDAALPARAARSPWPAPRRSCDRAAGRGRATPAPWGRGEDDVRLLDADEARGACSPPPASLGGDVHPATARRSTRPGWSAGWPGRSSAAASPIYERTRVRRDRARAGCDTDARRRCAPRSCVRATEGYTAAAGRPRAATVGAGLLADGRHRAAARRDVGADRAARTARRSPTTGT